MNPSVLPWPLRYMQDLDDGSLTPHHARQFAAQRQYFDYAPYEQAPHSSLGPPPNFGPPPAQGMPGSAGYQMGNDASMGMYASYNPIYQSFPPQQQQPSAGSFGNPNPQNAANGGNAAPNPGGAESQMQ